MRKFSLYGLFHTRSERLQDLPEEDTSPNLKRFFRLLGRNFWKIVTVNLMMLPMIIPIMVSLFLYLGVDKTPSQTSVIFPQIYGASLLGEAPETGFFLDLFGSQTMIPVYNATGTYVAIGILLGFLVLTFGWQNVGATYLLRGIYRGEAVFPVSDYFYAVKRDLKQGFFFGLLDFLILFLLGSDIVLLWQRTGNFMDDVMFFGVCVLSILYFFMRFYVYLLLITFQLSIRKILKNALIFVVLGIKRNLLAALGILLLVAFNIAFIAIFLPLNFAVPLILPLFYFLSFTAFMSTYAAYPIIDRYMIAPFATPTAEENAVPATQEPDEIIYPDSEEEEGPTDPPSDGQ